MRPGGAHMSVGIQNLDTAKSPPAAMPVPGQIASEQLRVGPSVEMSLRTTWASNLADACEQSGAQSALFHCVHQFSRGAPGFRGTPAGRQNTSIAQQTKFSLVYMDIGPRRLAWSSCPRSWLHCNAEMTPIHADG